MTGMTMTVMTKEEITKKQEILQTRISSIDYNLTGLINQKDKLINEEMRLQKILEALPAEQLSEQEAGA